MKRLVAIVAALLQLALPLAGYARAPFAPGANDVCSVGLDRADRHRHDGAPAGKHATTHCALCAHGTPPALPMSPVSMAATKCGAALSLAATSLPLPQPMPTPANARAPPVIAIAPT